MQRYKFYLNIIRFLRSGTIIEGIIVVVVFVVRLVFLFLIVAIILCNVLVLRPLTAQGSQRCNIKIQIIVVIFTLC